MNEQAREPDPFWPTYFEVPKPAHFRVRSDLLDELGAHEAIQRFTPHNEKSYRYWLGVTGLPEVRYPLATLSAEAAKPYQRTQRYVLRQIVAPGEDLPLNIVTDGNRRTGVLEFGGLFDFVFFRAAEFASYYRYRRSVALGYFYPKREPNTGATRRLAPWALGYEPAEGRCTILAQSREGSVGRFLDGQPGYLVPKFEPGRATL